MNLDDIRVKIDNIDKKMIVAFEDRMETVKSVAEYKIKNNIKVLDSSRENVVIDKAINRIKGNLNKKYVKQFYTSVLDVSRHMQHDIIEKHEQENSQIIEDKLSVAYLGIPGSFSEQAVIEHFGNCQMSGLQTFEEIIDGIIKDKYKLGMLPIENSTTGSVNPVVDLLRDYDVHIIGESVVKIHHHLLGIQGTHIDDIRNVYSHPQALEQCRNFMIKNNIEMNTSKNTSMAAYKVSKDKDKTIGAIASTRAAELYNLDILKHNIQTNSNNYTRFVIVSKNNIEVTDADKISIVCIISHKPGSLSYLINVFSKYDINLLKLESRPMLESPWHYCFYLDLAGNLKDEKIQKAIDDAEKYCKSIKLLGNYKSYEKE